MRELVTFIDLHLELVARELYPKAFFGGTISEGNAARVRQLLTRNIAAFQRLARFAPYVAGSEFSQADCAAWASLPVIAMATKLVYGEDLLAAAGMDWKAYQRFVGERPSAQRVTADRKAWQERAAAQGLRRPAGAPQAGWPPGSGVPVAATAAAAAATFAVTSLR